jgi:hypothetical protein
MTGNEPRPNWLILGTLPGGASVTDDAHGNKDERAEAERDAFMRVQDRAMRSSFSFWDDPREDVYEE